MKVIIVFWWVIVGLFGKLYVNDAEYGGGKECWANAYGKGGDEANAWLIVQVC